MAYLNSTDFDPSLLALVGGNATNSDKQNALAMQLQLAGALRNKGNDHGTMAGAMYIPPNPLQTALDNIDHIQGIRDSQGGKAKSDALIGQRGNALNAFIQSYFGKKDPSQQDPSQQDPSQQGTTTYFGGPDDQ